MLTEPVKPVFIANVPVPLIFIAAFTFTLLAAVSVSIFALQLTGALTLMSPGSLPVAAVVMLTLLLFSAVVSASAPIPLVVCTPAPEAIVKLVGSSNQVPVFPNGASVVTEALLAILRLLPEVST